MAKIKTVKSFDPSNPNVMVIVWNDGKTSNYDLESIPDETRLQCLFHGVKQKTMDAHSQTYRLTGSIAECRDVSDGVYENLTRGEWSEGRGSAPWIIEALVEILGYDMARAVDTWNALDDDGKKKVRTSKDVVRWKAKRDLERAESLGDDDEGLADLVG